MPQATARKPRGAVRAGARPRRVTASSVGVRELRQNLSIYLDRVKRGAVLQVTEHGRTVAVLAGGLSRIYPPEHAELAAAVAENGALVSEATMDAEPLPGMFPPRNRIISGLSRAVVVVEASERSGTLITARHAAEQGREVFAVPGPVDSPVSAGWCRARRASRPSGPIGRATIGSPRRNRRRSSARDAAIAYRSPGRLAIAFRQIVSTSRGRR